MPSTPFRFPPPAFTPGAVVFNRTDGARGTVIAVTYTHKDVLFNVAWGHDTQNDHYEFELTTVKPIDGVEADD